VATALSTILVVVTLIYAYLTLRIAKASERAALAAESAAQEARNQARAAEASIKELQEQRVATVRPLLLVERATPVWHGETLTTLRLELKNAGPGSALYPSVSVSRQDSRDIVGSESAWDAVEPLGQLTFDVRINDLVNDDGNTAGLLEVRVSFYDVLGRQLYADQSVEAPLSHGSSPAKLGIPAF